MRIKHTTSGVFLESAYKYMADESVPTANTEYDCLPNLPQVVLASSVNSKGSMAVLAWNLSKRVTFYNVRVHLLIYFCVYQLISFF